MGLRSLGATQIGVPACRSFACAVPYDPKRRSDEHQPELRTAANTHPCSVPPTGRGVMPMRDLRCARTALPQPGWLGATPPPVLKLFEHVHQNARPEVEPPLVRFSGGLSQFLLWDALESTSTKWVCATAISRKQFEALRIAAQVADRQPLPGGLAEPRNTNLPGTPLICSYRVPSCRRPGAPMIGVESDAPCPVVNQQSDNPRIDEPTITRPLFSVRAHSPASGVLRRLACPCEHCIRRGCRSTCQVAPARCGSQRHR